MVHFKLAYGSITAAKAFPDGIGVAAILFKSDGINHEYGPLYVFFISNSKSIVPSIFHFSHTLLVLFIFPF